MPPPLRQYVVRDDEGQFVARVDLAWPELGLFLELDGQQHRGQPAGATARRIAALGERARRRPGV